MLALKCLETAQRRNLPAEVGDVCLLPVDVISSRIALTTRMKLDVVMIDSFSFKLVSEKNVSNIYVQHDSLVIKCTNNNKAI